MKKYVFLGLGIAIGVVVPFFVVGLLAAWLIYSIRKVVALNTGGTRILATIKRVDPKSMRSITYENNKVKIFQETIYMMFAEWQHPETSKIYTFKSVVRNPEKFVVGNTIPFLVDVGHPRWHRLENPQEALVS